MRIALVTDYYLPTLGGVQTAVKATKEALEQAGHEVTVFTPLRLPSDTPGVVRLPVASRFAPDGYPFTWPPARARAELERAFRRLDVDVVHVHSEMYGALAGIRAARALGLPVVQTMHGRVDVYAQTSMPLPAITSIAMSAMHRGQLSHADHAVSASTRYTATRVARRMWRLMVSQANHADRVIVPSAHFAAKLVAQGVHAPLTVLSNGLEASVLRRIGDPVERDRGTGDLAAMWCGRMSPEKRPQLLVDAAQRIGGVHAHMYGDGACRARIRRSGDPAHVTVHGPVPQHDALAAMRRHHVLVSSSYDFDNQPMVILEAIASGMPVVYTDPDLSEMFPAGGGLLTRTPDVAGLAAALTRLRDEPGLVTQLSREAIAGRERVSQAAQMERLMEIYRDVARPRTLPRR